MTLGSVVLSAIVGSCSSATPPVERPAVAVVEVTPTQVSLVVGDTARFIASPRTASGAGVDGCNVGWTSSVLAVAEVDGSGLTTALAVGDAIITASCEGVQGSGVVEVAPAASDIDTVFSDAFEAGALGDPGRWQDIVGTGWAMVRAADEGIPPLGGDRVLKIQASGGAVSHFVTPADRIRLSYWMYRKAGYASGGLRSGMIRGSRDQWGSFGVGGSCPDDPDNAQKQEFFALNLTQPAAEGWRLRMYNYWLGMQRSTPTVCYGTYGLGPEDTPPITYYDITFAPAEGGWYHYEMELQLNTPGQADGWEKVWVDGVLRIEHANVKYREDPDTRIWAVTIDPGTIIDGSTAYVDDVVVTTPRDS